MARKRDAADVSKDSDVQAIREKFEYGEAEWRDARDEGKKDVLCLSGQVWEAMDPAGLKQRQDAKRPHLALDELGQYVNQLINDIRASKRGIKITPTGLGARDEWAEARQNLIRQIEYLSHAQMAYTTMFENAVQRGYGFLRIVPVFAADMGFDQELRIQPVFNPDMVTMDPDAQRSDGSDMEWLFYKEWWAVDQFTREFGKDAAVQDFTNVHRTDAAAWFRDRKVQVAEYWAVESKPRTLLLIAGADGQPQPVWEDNLPEGTKAENLRSRTVDTKYVCQKLTNGLEVLRKTDWPGKHIPFVACFGKALYVDEGGGAKRQLMSLVRLMRDPFMLYCYYRTTEAELVGMTPKFPYFYYDGSMDPKQEAMLAKSLHEPVAGIKIKPKIEGLPVNAPTPYPQRQPYDPPIQAMVIGAEEARRAIQAAGGSGFLPTEAQKRNEKSGVALRQIETSAQKGSYHFIDHFEDALRHTGVILNDLIPHYYDTARDIHLRKSDDSPYQVRINDPQAPYEETGQPLMMTEGEYDVTVSTGPADVSEREAADKFLQTLIGPPLEIIARIAGPKVASAVMAMAIKMQPFGEVKEQIADWLMPAEMKGEHQMTPEMMQAQQMIQMAMQKVQELEQELATDSVKAQKDLALAQIKGELDKAKILLKGKVDLALQDDQQAHEMAMAGADAAVAEKAAQQQMALSIATGPDPDTDQRPQPQNASE
jgi:hypothetical protein